jgi:hypothetical protein
MSDIWLAATGAMMEQPRILRTTADSRCKAMR